MRAHDEMGELDAAAGHARELAQLLKAGPALAQDFRLQDAALRLKAILAKQPRTNTLAPNEVEKIDAALSTVCSLSNADYTAFPALPRKLIASDPILGRQIIGHRSLDRYVACVRENRAHLEGIGRSWDKNLRAAAFGDAVFVLAIRNDVAGAKELIAETLDKREWLFSLDDRELEPRLAERSLWKRPGRARQPDLRARAAPHAV